MTRIPSINGLRGLAILAVVFEHLTASVRPTSGPFIPGTAISLSPLISQGGTGVNLFFILSGFVLFLPYAGGRRLIENWHDAWRFYRARFLRLMPLYYVAIAFDLAMAPQSWATSVWLFSGLFSLNVLDGPHTWNWALWSIGVEILFSVLFPAIVVAWRWVGPAKICLFALGLSLLTRVVAYLVVEPATGSAFMTTSLPARLDEFIWGMALAHLFANGAIGQRCASLLFPGMLLVLASWTTYDLTSHGNLPEIARAIAQNVLDLGLSMILAATLAPIGAARRVLTWPPLQMLGVMCYSVYIWHVPVIRLLGPSHQDNFSYAVGSILCLLTITIVASLSYRIIEFPRVRDWRALFLLRTQ